MDSAPAMYLSRPSALNLRDYPHCFPPPGYVEFNREGQIINLAAATASVPNADATILIPVQQKGFLKQFAVFMSTYGASPGPTWTLYQNGQALRDYTNRAFPLGALQTPVERNIRLYPNQPLTLGFNNAGATAVTVGWSMYGWYFPAK